MHGILALILGLALLSGGAAPATAGGVVLWDRQIASAITRGLRSDGVCRRVGYGGHFPICEDKALSGQFVRQDHQPTLLDEIAMFVHRHKDLNLRRELLPGTRVKFRARLSTLYGEEAEVQLTLEIRF